MTQHTPAARRDDDAHVKSNYVDCRLWMKEASPRLTPVPAAAPQAVALAPVPGGPVLEDAHLKSTYVECRLWLEPHAARLAPAPQTPALSAR